MFNYLNWGGYITFHLYPEQLAFVDSVADVTGEVTMEYETVIDLLPGWDDVLQNYDIQWVIIPSDTPLADTLIEKNQWKVLYEDETAILLRK